MQDLFQKFQIGVREDFQLEITYVTSVNRELILEIDTHNNSQLFLLPACFQSLGQKDQCTK